MSRDVFSAYLYIEGVNLKAWALSGSTRITTALHGVPVDRDDIPGLIFGFPSVQGATKAAARLYEEERRTLGNPKMAIDRPGDLKKLPTLTFGLADGTVLVTKAAARFLASEPVDLKPGPQIPDENGPFTETFLFPTGGGNMAWALPSIDFDPKASPYFQAKEIPVIQFPRERSGDYFKHALSFFRWGLLFGIPTVALLIAFSLVRHAIPRKPIMPPEAEMADAADPASQPAPEVAATVPPTETAPPADPKMWRRLIARLKAPPTPVPVGFADVTIRTKPLKAEIFVNDQRVGGKSPVELKHQDIQTTYKLVIQKKGYEPYVKIFNVEPGQNLVVDAQLEKSPSR